MSIEGAVATADLNVIWISLQRHRRGLLVRVKVSPEVEEFFRGFNAMTERVTDYGTSWLTREEPKPGEPALPPLRAWSFRHDPNMNLGYDLINLGNPLSFVDPRKGRNLVNISFLRLEGASQVDGTSFILDTIISRPEMEKLTDALMEACGAFYADYIKPAQYDINVNVVPSPFNSTFQMSRPEGRA